MKTQKKEGFGLWGQNKGLLIGTVIERPQNDEYKGLNMGWRRG